MIMMAIIIIIEIITNNTLLNGSFLMHWMHLPRERKKTGLDTLHNLSKLILSNALYF